MDIEWRPSVTATTDFLSPDILKGFGSADPALTHTLRRTRATKQKRSDTLSCWHSRPFLAKPEVLPRSRTMAGSAGSSCTPSRMPVRRTHGRRTDTVKSLVMPKASARARALDRLQSMDVVADIGEQSWIAQLFQPEIVDEHGKSVLALIEGAGADRENAAGAADAADARVMRRCGARADGRRCDQSRSE